MIIEYEKRLRTPKKEKGRAPTPFCLHHHLPPSLFYNQLIIHSCSLSLPHHHSVIHESRILFFSETRSIEDIDSAFKQIQGEVYSEKQIIAVPVHEKLIVESKYPWGESNSNLEMVEARSLEDIDTAFKQATEDNKENDSRTDESGFQSSSNTRP